MSEVHLPALVLSGQGSELSVALASREGKGRQCFCVLLQLQSILAVVLDAVWFNTYKRELRTAVHTMAQPWSGASEHLTDVEGCVCVCMFFLGSWITKSVWPNTFSPM